MKEETKELLWSYKKRIQNVLLNSFYRIICNPYIKILNKHDLRMCKHYLSLCLIFKNESPFLKEWLDYHLSIGVDHFYLYNNNSTDDYGTVLAPYVEDGLVTLVDFPYDYAQMKAYEDCYTRYREESNWISFLDVDEFICPKKHENIKTWLRGYDKYPGVMINWLMFGTGGRIKHDYKCNVIEQYYLCWKYLHPYGKCILNTRWEVATYKKWYVHHHTMMKFSLFGFNIPIPVVDQFGRIHTIETDVDKNLHQKDDSQIQINHYFTKSWDIYSQKISKSDVYFKDNPKKNINYFYKFESRCSSMDFSISRFFIKMKLNQKIIEIPQ